MGEVYRARDTRLQRDVALKVLSDAHLADERRLARLKREALVLASLVHPHIATLFAVEESGPTTALVMELVDGETLADRITRCRDINRGCGLPLNEALRIAAQIADALEAAHACGIVHRDLKPANIKVGHDGSVKVLDFGLAGVLETEFPDVSAPAEVTAPTVTMAEGGSIVGTPAYMSPEQARGDAVDASSDVWAFGCTLFEMLTGRRAFQGETTTGVLMSVLEHEPDLAALPIDTPLAIRRLLRRALVKDRRMRLRHIGDARLEIVEAGAGVDPDASGGSVGRLRSVPLLTVALASALAAALLVGRWGRSPAPPTRMTRFDIPAPAESGMVVGAQSRDVAISPDGWRIAIPSQKGLIIRQRDKLVPETLETGNTPGSVPFFSPDGRWIGYTTDGALMKVAVTGGPPVQIAEASVGVAGIWGLEHIVFADATGVYRVPGNGGTPEKLPVRLGPTEQAAFPEVLPGGQVVLLTVLATRTNVIGPASESPQARIDALDLRTGGQTTILRGGGRPRYLPTGHLLYGLNQRLYGISFNVDRLEAVGEPVELISEAGASEFAISNEGTLVYVSGRPSRERDLVWVDHHSQEESLGAPLREYLYPRLSPDGNRVALDVQGADRDIWIWDITRRLMERFTTDPSENVIPAWTRDGQRLAFGSSRSGVPNVFWQASNGSGEPERLLESTRLQQPVEFAPDGRLLISEAVPGRGRDILALALELPRRVEPILDGEGTEGAPDVSSDGRWIAYDSNESGQFEVYVRPYPRTKTARWRISTTGGRQPLWSPDGHALYFRDFAGALIKVPVTTTPTFVPGLPIKLFDGDRYVGRGSQLSGRNYDISRDGSRFLMIKAATPTRAGALAIVVTEHWLAELSARVPSSAR